FKEVIALVQGKGAYSRLKFEGGVHRVQRVPVTETQGRIHTSAVTVAVLPEAEDVEVDLADKELRIDVFRSSGPGGQSVNTTDSAVAAAIEQLGTAGVPEPRPDAEVLLAHALGTSRTAVIARAREPLLQEVAARFERLVARRAARVPLHHLVGEREFWSLPFAVDARVLIPRPETELLVETALAVAPAARRVLDLGTGSGAVAAALARALPAARVWASDRERDALAVARANLGRHAPGVGCVAADLIAPWRAGAFDLIVSNPPYV